MTVNDRSTRLETKGEHMRCPNCEPWNQDDPNCGHAMYGIGDHEPFWLPARWFTRVPREAEIFGMGRAWHYLKGENEGHAETRQEHVRRQVAYAMEGGW